MFVRQNQQQFRNSNADVQIFYGTGTGSASGMAWSKPPGVSHVYMMCIGKGADGDGATGGGSGAVTVWYGAAQHVPDFLDISISTNSAIRVKLNLSSPSVLISANGSALPTSSGASAMTANQFTASGFFQSIAGDGGGTGGGTASATTFLCGGNDATIVGPYGYRSIGNAGTRGNGYFGMQPIIFGIGGVQAGIGGIGCGGGASSGIGGPGMVLIASW